MQKQNALFFDIARQYGTPFYFYDQQVLQQSYQSLRAVFPKQVDIFYSVKANPNVTLCALLRQLGACAEVSSFIELETACRAGFSAENIIFLGPAKTTEELIMCIRKDIAAIVCESKTEFVRIALLAKRAHHRVKVALRINPHFVSKTAALKMGGQSSQFGMDEDMVLNDLKFFFEHPQIEIVGIQVYNGTRILDAQTIFENTQNIFQLFRKINASSGGNFNFLDIGGGLGIPYFEGEQPLDLAMLKNLLQPIIEAFIAEFPWIRLILETGRFLLAPAGVLVSRVVDKKISKGETYLVTDGGTNCHMAAVGIGSWVKRNFPIQLLSQQAEEQHNERVHIVGPLCTPGDLLAKNIELPVAKIGDLIVVRYSGAYGLTASPGLFLSHGFPAEFLLQENKIHLIRARQKEADFFNNQFLIKQNA